MVAVLWEGITASSNSADRFPCVMYFLVQAGHGEGGSKAAERKTTEK